METPSNTIIKAPKTPRTSEELLCVSFSDLSFACNYSVVRTMDWRMMYEDATYETSNNTNGADTIRLLLSKKRENDTERMSLIRNILLLGSVHASVNRLHCSQSTPRQKQVPIHLLHRRSI